MSRRVCANCGHRKDLWQYDYTQGGCKHLSQPGFACDVFAGDGVIVNMIGLDEEKDRCEEWTKRK